MASQSEQEDGEPIGTGGWRANQNNRMENQSEEEDGEPNKLEDGKPITKFGIEIANHNTYHRMEFPQNPGK